LISEIPKNISSCIDRGCGNAYYFDKLYLTGIKRIIGIDNSEQMLKSIDDSIKNFS
jgi:hypothetical protein